MKDIAATETAFEPATTDVRSEDWVVIRRNSQGSDVESGLSRSRRAAAHGTEDGARDPSPVVAEVGESREDAPSTLQVEEDIAAEPVTPQASPETEAVPSGTQIAPRPTQTLLPQWETPEDIWAELTPVRMGAQIGGKPARRGMPSLLDVFRADPIAKGFDQLRTRLVRTLRAYGWRRIAVVSPTAGCGTTFTAVNLALSLSRVPGSRTILMDMNQRRPGVAKALGLRNPGKLDEFLGAEIALEDYLVRAEETLALGLADRPSDLAAETLHDPLTGEVLDDMIEALDPSLVIYDMPAMLEHDDLGAFLPQVDGVLLVADGLQTTPEHIAACERVLDGQIQLLGVVLNRGRAEATTGR